MSQDEAWLLQEKYSGVETEAFFHDVERLRAGEPLAYIIGSIPFLHTKIFLDSRPLIPRTETEFWVEKVISKVLQSHENEVSILDLCAGSGCIGVAILNDIPRASVDFAEIDEMHHPTIRRNIEENNLSSRVFEIYGGSLFEKITQKYDYIISNPPYIDASLNRTADSVKKYEPEIALYGGADGMELITHIIDNAPIHLTDRGVLVLEHEPEQGDAIARYALIHGFTCQTYPDQFGVARYTVCSRTTPSLVAQ